MMIAELREKSQLTLPKAICKKLNLSKGDTFDVVDQNGVICLVPVVVHTREYVQSIENELQTHDKETLRTLRRAESLRSKGVADISVSEFETNMRKAIAGAAGSGK